MTAEDEIRALLEGWVEAGREPGGSLCVVRDGRLVVEVVAGNTDGDTPWTSDTLVMTYSVAKPFAALAVLSTVAEGLFALDDRVAELWPAYAVHGKAPTTVRQVLAHQAGVPVFPAEAADIAFDDLDALCDLLAGATPLHPPGAAIAEHALTYGHLCDRLVRAATGEDLAARFAAIADAHGWDLHLRVGDADLGRVADVVALDGWPATHLDDPSWGPALSRPAGLLDPAVVNSPRWRRTSFPAIGMHASAGALARFYDDITTPDGAVGTLLGPDLFAAYVGPAATGHDLVVDREVTWTLGFQVDDEDLGMGGIGGCVGWQSRRHGFSGGYVTRGLGGPGRLDELWDLLDRVG